MNKRIETISPGDHEKYLLARSKIKPYLIEKATTTETEISFGRLIKDLQPFKWENESINRNYQLRFYAVLRDLEYFDLVSVINTGKRKWYFGTNKTLPQGIYLNPGKELEILENNFRTELKKKIRSTPAGKAFYLNDFLAGLPWPALDVGTVTYWTRFAYNRMFVLSKSGHFTMVSIEGEVAYNRFFTRTDKPLKAVRSKTKRNARN